MLDLKCSKLEIKLKQLFRKILKPVIEEINETEAVAYQSDQVYFVFGHEVMSNEQENAQNALTKAQEMQTMVNTLLSLADNLDNETLMQNICEVLDLDYEKSKTSFLTRMKQ